MLKLIKTKATKYDLQHELVCALIWQESRGNPWATRYEDGFFHRYLEVPKEKLPGHFPVGIPTEDTERRLRACSFGLMQIMGNTARLMGYQKADLTRLFVPAINLEFGCRYLKRCWDRATGDTHELRMKGALACYNTGRTAHEKTQYDEIVLRHLASGDYKLMFE